MSTCTYVHVTHTHALMYTLATNVHSQYTGTHNNSITSTMFTASPMPKLGLDSVSNL